MAEGIRRPTVTENVETWSKRLAAANPGPDRFELAKLFADHLVEAWAGFHQDPQKCFEVHVRGEQLVVRCLTPRAHGWQLLQKRARRGFGGREVVLEKAWAPLTPPEVSP